MDTDNPQAAIADELESPAPVSPVPESSATDRVEVHSRTEAAVASVIATIAPIVKDEAEHFKAAPRNLQLAVAGSVGFLVASVFEWWSGFARVTGVVQYSAAGSGNAYSDWRGWIAVFAALVVLVASGIQISRRDLLSDKAAYIARKAALIHAFAALGCTLWVWAAFSAAADLSDGLSLDFGASFGLYAALAGAATACVACVREYRSSGTEEPIATSDNN